MTLTLKLTEIPMKVEARVLCFLLSKDNYAEEIFPRHQRVTRISSISGEDGNPNGVLELAVNCEPETELGSSLTQEDLQPLWDALGILSVSSVSFDFQRKFLEKALDIFAGQDDQLEDKQHVLRGEIAMVEYFLYQFLAYDGAVEVVKKIGNNFLSSMLTEPESRAHFARKFAERMAEDPYNNFVRHS